MTTGLSRIRLVCGQDSTTLGEYLETRLPAPHQQLTTTTTTTASTTSAAALATLLATTVVVEVEPLSRHPTALHQISQTDIINRCIEKLVKEGKSNVLSLGYRKLQGFGSSHGVSLNHHGVENYFPNTVVNYLKSSEWELLLERNCYVQVCGLPIYEKHQSKYWRSANVDELANAGTFKRTSSNSSVGTVLAGAPPADTSPARRNFSFFSTVSPTKPVALARRHLSLASAVDQITSTSTSTSNSTSTSPTATSTVKKLTKRSISWNPTALAPVQEVDTPSHQVTQSLAQPPQNDPHHLRRALSFGGQDETDGSTSGPVKLPMKRTSSVTFDLPDLKRRCSNTSSLGSLCAQDFLLDTQFEANNNFNRTQDIAVELEQIQDSAQNEPVPGRKRKRGARGGRGSNSSRKRRATNLPVPVTAAMRSTSTTSHMSDSVVDTPEPTGARLPVYYINRSRAFHALSAQGLPAMHPLKVLGCSNRNARRLLSIILLAKKNLRAIKFDRVLPNSRQKPNRLPSTLIKSDAVSLFARVLARQKNCHYVQMIDHWCPLPARIRVKPANIVVEQSTPEGEPLSPILKPFSPMADAPAPVYGPEMTYRDLISCSSSYYQVSSFLSACCHQLLPFDLLGSDANWKLLHNKIKLFVRMRRFDKFSSTQCMSGISTKELKWINSHACNAQDHIRQQRIAEAFLVWIFEGLLVPLLRGFFYATETGPYRNRLFYFRKPVWRKISAQSMGLLKVTLLETVSKKQAGQILAARTMPFSFLRMLPKTNNTRPIINMGRRPTKTEFRGGRVERFPLSINSTLQNLFHVLTFEKCRDDGMLIGSAIFGLEEIGRKLEPFRRALNAIKETTGTTPPLYFVSVDVSHAFDTIKRDKLFAIIKLVLREHEYVLRRFTTVSSAGGRTRIAYKRSVFQPSQPFSQFIEFSRQMIKESGNMHDLVFADRVVSHTVSREELLNQLYEHVYHNLIKIGKKFYQTRDGIPQGSVLSTLLCAFFYGDMERRLFSSLPSDRGCLIRFVDDFFLVTTERQHAEEFLRIMSRGIPDYGCFINREKTLVNFDVTIDGQPVRRLENLAGFNWCGFLFDTQTLEIRVDYTRYSGDFMSETLTSDLSVHPGMSIQNKLLCFVKPRLLSMLVNPLFCSINTISLNMYQIALLCAVKFHCHIAELPVAQRTASNPPFFKQVVLKLADVVHGCILRHIQRSSERAVMPLCKDDVLWLTLHAFMVILQRKQTSHAALLNLLEPCMTAAWLRNPHRAVSWRATVDHGSNHVFRTILY